MIAPDISKSFYLNDVIVHFIQKSFLATVFFVEGHLYDNITHVLLWGGG